MKRFYLGMRCSINNLLFFALFSLLLIGNFCNAKIKIYGHLPERAVVIGQSADNVRIAAGEPSFTDGKSWYYVEVKLKENNIGLGKKYFARTTKVTFDSQAKVSALKEFKIDGKKPLEATKRSELRDEKQSISKKLSQVFGNVAPTL